ncbi:MAG: polysaccharide biosynthesis C-terminal domain-containing protein [Victivallales bacterium]|nr:polysaccharide biosynthesis C-terminal domain-containing protein [Victivallales bacterium]
MSGIELSHRLVYLPVGIFGVAISSVCLTDMSRAAANHDKAALTESLEHALRMVLFLSIPCAVLFGVLADPFVRLLFRHGAFNDEAVRSCVYALLFYIPGIPAFCAAKVALTPHYANHDVKTPVRISIVCVLLNLVLNLSLVVFLRHGGLALSTSICSWVNVITLITLARKYTSDWTPKGVIIAALRILLVSLLSGAVVLGLLHLLPRLFDINGLPTLWASAIRVVLGGSIGWLCYLILSCRSPECRSLLAPLMRRMAR